VKSGFVNIVALLSFVTFPSETSAAVIEIFPDKAYPLTVRDVGTYPGTVGVPVNIGLVNRVALLSFVTLPKPTSVADTVTLPDKA
jgi:hypothetical protein